MASFSEISEHFCGWRSHISTGDSIQAYDGRGWFAAKIYSVKINQKTKNKDILVGYENYSSSYDFWCPITSKRIRPTIGFLRKKIMVPQANTIKSLLKEQKRLKQENKQLVSSFKRKYNEQDYEYLAVKKLSGLKNDDSSFKNEEVKDQEEIEDILMNNVKILSEWNKITKELDMINDELNQNVTNNNADCANIKDLVRIQTMIEKRIEIQQQRLESSQNNIILPVMTQKFKIDDKINKYQNELKRINSENYETGEKYKITKNDCKQLLNSLHDLTLYCNQKINEANVLNKCQTNMENEVCKLENFINQYNDYSLSYFDLLKGFQKFQVLNKDYISNSVKKINFGWKKIEGLWYKWQSDDILLWIQHKMKWMNKNAVPNCLNFDIILENMERKQINGISLLTLKKIDLLHIGFTMNSHRTIIYQFIKALITKNKIPNDDIHDCAENNGNDNNNDNNDTDNTVNTNNEEGEPPTQITRNDAIIPSKYKCSLTNVLMCEPVICGHNNKLFEKSAIHKYINEYGKLPLVDTFLMSQINIYDEASFLLFDDLSLTIEIEQFKQEHDL